MSKKHRRPSEKSVSELLDGFEETPRRIVGSSDSAHKLVIGTYAGEEVAVKPFRSRHGVTKARNELAMSKLAIEKGFRVPEPVKVVEKKRQLVAFYISRYISDATGAHTHTFEAEPESAAGEAVQGVVKRVSSELGNLHASSITHGDSQIKNFSTFTPAVDPYSQFRPIVFDFENGKLHSAPNGDYKDQVMDDIARLAYSLGTRQFGGKDDKVAAEFARHAIIDPHVNSPVSESLGNTTLAHVIDHAAQNFMAGRQDKELIDKSYAHIARVKSEFDIPSGTLV